MWALIVLSGAIMLAALAMAVRLGAHGPGAALGLGTLGGFLIAVHSIVLLAGLLGGLTVIGVAVLAGAGVVVVAACLARGWTWPPPRAAPACPPPPAAPTFAGGLSAPSPSGAATLTGGLTGASPSGATFTAWSLVAPAIAIVAGAVWAWPHAREATRLWVWDDFTYHMVYPALWLREQAIAAVPPVHAFTMQAWYPLSASVVATWFMVPFPHARAEALAWVSLTGLLYAGLVAAGAATVCRRLGCHSGAWAVPVALFATSHRTAIMAGSFSDADLAQAACLFAALAFAVPRGEVETARDVRVDGAYAALLSGLALGVKVSAAVPALVILLALAVRARALATRPAAGMRAAGAVVLMFAVSWTATAGYWYARNVIHTGNPVYPAAFLAWTGVTFPETTLIEYGQRYGLARAVADALPVYLNWPAAHAWLALLGLAGLAVWLAVRRRALTRPQRYFAATALGTAAAVLIALPAAPFSAGNAMTFRSGFIHWDSMRYVAIVLFLGWAALGVLVDAGAGATRWRTSAAILVAAAGALASDARWAILALASAILLGCAAVLRVPGLHRHAHRACPLAADPLEAVDPAAFRQRLRVIGMVAAILVGAAIIAWSHDAKVAAGRAAFYREPLFGAAAAVLDRQPPGTRLAVFGDQWVYPAFGDRLHLRPVRLDADGSVATSPIAGAMEPGERTVAPAAFRARLEAERVDLVVVVRQPHPGRPAGLPAQHAALEAAGDAELLHLDRAVAIWRVGTGRRGLSPYGDRNADSSRLIISSSAAETEPTPKTPPLALAMARVRSTSPARSAATCSAVICSQMPCTMWIHEVRSFGSGLRSSQLCKRSWPVEPGEMPDVSTRSRMARRSLVSSVPSAQATSARGMTARAPTVSGRMPRSRSLSRIAGLVMPDARDRASREVSFCFSSRRRSISR
jgi:hypothetical protein